MTAITTIQAARLPSVDNPAPTLTSQPLCGRLTVAVAGQLIRSGTLTKDDLPSLYAFQAEARRLLRGSTSEEIFLHVGKLSLHYPAPQINEDANATRWDDWYDDFADIPPDILDAACRAWRRSANRFAPSPGQLLEKCVSVQLRQALADRAKAAIELLEAQ